MKLKDLIKIEERPALGGAKRFYARLNIWRAKAGSQSDDELKTELCRDVMSDLGLSEKEMIELERRKETNHDAI